jgi:hypothetical protein
MKPAVLIAVVFGAIIAGGAGGFLAAQFAAPTPTAPVPQLASAPAAEHDDLKPELDTHAGKIVKLTSEVDRLVVRLNAAEEKAKQADVLAAKVEGLTKQLETVRANPGSTGEVAPGTADENKLREMIKEEMVQHEKDQAAQAEAERDKRFEDMRTAATKRSLDTLTEKLSLDSVQVPKMKAILDSFSAKGAEIMRKGGEARRNGEEFDFRAEVAAANTAATEEVKALLSSAQLTTFNELVGDRGLRAVTDQGWGMGPGGNNPGGNRRGGNRGGNNND